MPNETATVSRRGASGLTLIEMSMLVALVGVAMIGLAERQFILAEQKEPVLEATIQDMQIVSDALVAWANDNRGRRTRWPHHLYALVSGCEHNTIPSSTINPIDRFVIARPRHVEERLGACHPNYTGSNDVTGGYLFKLPASRAPASSCTAESGGVNCEYHFDKSTWATVNGVKTPPPFSEGVTVQYMIEHNDSASVERLAERVAQAWPNVTIVPAPGIINRRIIRFAVFRPMECTADPYVRHDADKLVYRCDEGRIVKFARADLRNVRRIALRGEQDSIIRSDSINELDTTPLSGPGITMPVPPKWAITYQMRLGTVGVGRDQYLEMIRDKVADGPWCIPDGLPGTRYGHPRGQCGEFRVPLTWRNVLRTQRGGVDIGSVLDGAIYPGMPRGHDEPVNPGLWLHYRGATQREFERWQFDRDPLIRLRVSNRVADDSFRVGHTAFMRDAHNDIRFGTRIDQRTKQAEPYLDLCADHEWAGAAPTVDTRRASTGGRTITFDQYVAEPCETGVAMSMYYRNHASGDDHWDITLNEGANHRTLQTRLCALEAAASNVAQDCSCQGTSASC